MREVQMEPERKLWLQAAQTIHYESLAERASARKPHWDRQRARFERFLAGRPG